ncbi:MAG: dienelactone hydrolase family protein, partial [Bacteroidota bacterium]
MLTPDGFDSGKKFPLVLFFHGSGERGNDNSSQLQHGSSLFVDKENRKKFPAFVVFPQCPENTKWVDVDWKHESDIMPVSPTPTMNLVISLLDTLTKYLPIDTARIYVMGLSMGGFGTWDIISRFPGKFAAAVPICGGGDENQADRLIKTPIWAFHGSLDPLV